MSDGLSDHVGRDATRRRAVAGTGAYAPDAVLPSLARSVVKCEPGALSASDRFAFLSALSRCWRPAAAAATRTRPGGAARIDVEIPPDVPFDPAQWTTPPTTRLGDRHPLRELQDRPFTISWLVFPPTLRTEGPNANLVKTSTVHQLLYETLIQLHPETEEFLPYLASHWRIENDDATGTQVFWFHIDELARWADGEPVTAADVYYSWWHRVQQDRNDPSSYITYTEGFEEPEIVDRLTIKVRTKTMNWRLFPYFGGLTIFPAKEIAIPGEQYLQDYNWSFVTGSGPYQLASEATSRKASR